MRERIAVLGASGYVGSAVVSHLRTTGYDVVGAANSAHETYDAVDVRDRCAVRAFLEDVDGVVNAAALVGTAACDSRPETAYDVNARGAANVALACRHLGIPLVHLSSVATVGVPASLPITAATARRPETTYGRTKLLGEQAVEMLAGTTVPTVTLVLTNVIGGHEAFPAGGGSVVDYFLDRAAADEPLPVHRPGTQERDLIHVRDVARAITAAIDALDDLDPAHHAYVLGSGTTYSVLELAGLVSHERGDWADRSPGIELCDRPDSDAPVLERFDVDPSALESAVGVAPERSIGGWIAHESRRRAETRPTR